MVRLLETGQLARDFTELRLKLSAFARKLAVHLDLEARFVCARLLRHSDPKVAMKAKEHTAAEASQFVEETKGIFESVSTRCDLEDRELYPIVDRIGSRSGTWHFELGPREG
jgi:hypothetical protein